MSTVLSASTTGRRLVIAMIFALLMLPTAPAAAVEESPQIWCGDAPSEAYPSEGEETVAYDFNHTNPGSGERQFGYASFYHEGGPLYFELFRSEAGYVDIDDLVKIDVMRPDYSLVTRGLAGPCSVDNLIDLAAGPYKIAVSYTSSIEGFRYFHTDPTDYRPGNDIDGFDGDVIGVETASDTPGAIHTYPRFTVPSDAPSGSGVFIGIHGLHSVGDTPSATGDVRIDVMELDNRPVARSNGIGQGEATLLADLVPGRTYKLHVSAPAGTVDITIWRLNVYGPDYYDGPGGCPDCGPPPPPPEDCEFEECDPYFCPDPECPSSV